MTINDGRFLLLTLLLVHSSRITAILGTFVVFYGCGYGAMVLRCTDNESLK